MVNALRRPGREVACPVTEVGVVVMVSGPTMQDPELDPAWMPGVMGMGTLAWYDPGHADVGRVDRARVNCSKCRHGVLLRPQPVALLPRSGLPSSGTTCPSLDVIGSCRYPTVDEAQSAGC